MAVEGVVLVEILVAGGGLGGRVGFPISEVDVGLRQMIFAEVGR